MNAKETQTTASSQSKMLRGSAWMTAGSIFSRVLGAIYIIPWWAWLGSAALAANGLFTKGYQIYGVFIIISTAGIPSAVAKQIAHYNAMSEYATSIRLWWHGMIATSILGVISAAILWFAAPLLAAGDSRMIPVFHSLAWAILVIPMLSIMRGYFQGVSDMAPSAISQLVEQFVRVIYMLASVYFIMKMGNGDYILAVTHSTFAAFIGALAGILMLVAIFIRRWPRIRAQMAHSANQIDVSVNQLLMDIARQAIPFIIMDSAINWYYIIDQYTYKPMWGHLFNWSVNHMNDLYALYAGNANKLIMIVVSLASAMGITVIPLLSAAVTRHEMHDVSRQMTNAIQLFSIVMIPASLGMMAIAQPLYVVFYGYDGTGIRMLEVSCILAVALGLYTVLAALLQGVFRNRLAIMLMLVGIVVKVVLQYPLSALFGAYGPMLASLAGLGVNSILMLRKLWQYYHFKVFQTSRRVAGMLFFGSLMFAVVRIAMWLMNYFIPAVSKPGAVAELIVALILGGGVYGYLVLKTHLADMILGGRVAGIRRILRMQ